MKPHMRAEPGQNATMYPIARKKIILKAVENNPTSRILQ
jgi:hypothetical protein